MNRINRQKYENVILYIAKKLGGTIDGKKKLAKLLYYIDFDRFEYKESMESVTGDRYLNWQMGPVPEKFKIIVNKLVSDGKLSEISIPTPYSHNMEAYIIKSEPDESVFDEDDKFIIDRVINKYGGLNGNQLGELTHSEAPWSGTEKNDEIPYSLAFYRGTDFSEHNLVRA